MFHYLSDTESGQWSGRVQFKLYIKINGKVTRVDYIFMYSWQTKKEEYCESNYSSFQLKNKIICFATQLDSRMLISSFGSKKKLSGSSNMIYNSNKASCNLLLNELQEMKIKNQNSFSH